MGLIRRQTDRFYCVMTAVFSFNANMNYVQCVVDDEDDYVVMYLNF